MAEAKGRWAQIRERRLNTPELREQYENAKRELMLTRQMLMQIDEQRRAAGLSKAALARSIEANPATLRRMFTAPTANPSMRTVFRLLVALGMELEVKRVRPPKAALFAQKARAASIAEPKSAARPSPRGTQAGSESEQPTS